MIRALAGVLALAGGLAAGFGGGALWVLSQGLPQVSRLETFRPPSSTRVYAADGSLLAEFAVQRRTPVPLEDMPPHLIRAFLAIEDHRFFEHIGLNLGRIAKALLVDLLERRIVEGGSTITQQLAKVLFLTPERTLRRKIREAILALEIERQYTKQEILEFYLNQIYLGNGAYGVAAAADVYFGKSVADLTLAEAALLAALPKAPARYDPFRNPERARRRRNLVLRRMAELGWVAPEDAREAAAAPLPDRDPPAPRIKARYFVETVRRQLLERLGLDLVYEGGLRVYTTLDPAVQRAAEEALSRGLTALEKRHPGRTAPVQGAVLVLDVRTGAVRAHVGGRNWSESPFDRAVQAVRQPGSAFKPFVYLAALEAGYTQASTVLDAPGAFPGARPDQPWEPSNYDRTFLGQMTFRMALAKSRNLPAVRVLMRVGRARVEAAARRLGLAGPLGQGPAEALGVGGVRLVELVRAYAAFASGGLLPEAHWIRAVYGADGRNLWPPPPAPRRVIDPATAYVLTDMLRAVVREGTGRAARDLPFAVAGKTGTTDDSRDAWFVGYTSRSAVGVWVGRDDNTPIGPRETGARAALPVWIEVVRAAARANPPPPWPVPPAVRFVEIDVLSGRRATPACRHTAHAAFVRGTEPKTPCDRERFAWPHLVYRYPLAPLPEERPWSL